jgi:hypothetical protein
LPTENKPHADCPFADRVNITDDGNGPHIEGRFSKLETQVSTLSSNLESIERSVAEGFKSVFAKIDSIGATRAANTIPWIMVGFAVLGLIATVGFQSINGVAAVVLKVENNLASANERERQYVKDQSRTESKTDDLGRAMNAMSERQEDFNSDIRHWQLRHAEEMDYFRGNTDAKINSLEKRANLTSERQYSDRMQRLQRFEDKPKE